jgi:hypothetical protein
VHNNININNSNVTGTHNNNVGKIDLSNNGSVNGQSKHRYSYSYTK